MMNKILSSLKSFYKYGTFFKGRSTKFEYWVGFVYYAVATTLLTELSATIFGSKQNSVISYHQYSDMFMPIIRLISLIALTVPFLYLVVRRLHDGNKSGYFALIYLPMLFLDPLLFLAISLVFGFIPTIVEGNKYGVSSSHPDYKPTPTKDNPISIIRLSILFFLFSTLWLGLTVILSSGFSDEKALVLVTVLMSLIYFGIDRSSIILAKRGLVKTYLEEPSSDNVLSTSLTPSGYIPWSSRGRLGKAIVIVSTISGVGVLLFMFLNWLFQTLF